MWDLAIDESSRDIVFTPSRDLLGVSGDELNRQRIQTRCKIRKGSFIYGRADLGSNLHKISRYDIDRQLREAAPVVQEALTPMDDIRITSITPSVTDGNQLFINVKYQPVVTGDEGELELPSVPEYDARVTI